MNVPDLFDFLPCRTPDAWVTAALAHPDILLIDHANCEKKAASTALNMMYRYVEHFELLNKMSRLAREELRHFEQVLAFMKKRKVSYQQITASRYAAGLHQFARKEEPHRLIDSLIVGAIIEARSCERFATLAPHLDAELGDFYRSLLKSESRHFADYLTLADKLSTTDIRDRVTFFLEKERSLIETDDSEFRFHSGVPVLSESPLLP